MKYSLPLTAPEKGRVIIRTSIQTWGAKLTKSQSVLYWSLRCNISFHFSRGGFGEYVDIKEEVIGERKIHNNRLYMLYASQNLVRTVNLQDGKGWGRNTRGRNEKCGGYLLEIVGLPVIYLQCRRCLHGWGTAGSAAERNRKCYPNYLLRIKEQNLAQRKWNFLLHLLSKVFWPRVCWLLVRMHSPVWQSGPFNSRLMHFG